MYLGYMVVYVNREVGSLCGITGFYGMSTIWNLTMKCISRIQLMEDSEDCIQQSSNITKLNSTFNVIVTRKHFAEGLT